MSETYTQLNDNETEHPAGGTSAGSDDAQYARIELMGHRTRVGQIQEVSRFGAALLRVDFWDRETDALATEYYNGASIYCLSPVSKEVVEAYVAREKSYLRPSLRHLPAPEDDADDEPSNADHDDDHIGDDEF